MGKEEHYAPSYHGPRFKWYKPLGAAGLVGRSAWRYFVTGKDLRGAGDNASWLHDATVDYRGGPRERLTRARWRRVSRRWAFLGAPWLLADVAAASALTRAITEHPPAWATVPWGWVFLAYVLLGIAVGAMWSGYMINLWWPQREIRKTHVYPAARTLAKVTGTKFRRRDALANIVMPAGFGTDIEDPAPVRVYVPDVVLDASAKKRIVDAIAPRLGLPDAQARWTESGVERAYVELAPMPLPPATVTLAGLMDALLATTIDRPIVGAGPGGLPVYTDFCNDSPHTLGSAGSGAGKSTIYKFIAMQRLRLGAYAIILDFKKWSHLRWAGQLRDRVMIEDEVPAIHNVLCRVLDELLWRKSFNLEQEEELGELPTLDIYVEEINTLMSLLGSYWGAEVARRKQEARTAMRHAKDSEDELAIGEAEEMLAEAMGLPKTSPAIDALRFGVNLGREFKIHFHFIGQSMSAKAAGGRDTRESFRTRLLARWDRKTWKMLADGIPFIVCPSTTVGVWAHVHGSEVEIVRVPFVKDADAAAFVRGGDAPALPMFHGDPRPSIEGTSTAAITEERATLRALAEMLPPKADGSRLSLEGLRSAAKRPGFPTPVGEPTPAGAEYLVEEIYAWFRDRERLSIEA